VRTTQRTDPPPPCGRGNTKHPCMPGRETRHGYGVELGLGLDFRAGGAAPAATVYGPTAMSEPTLRTGGYVTVP
jgi:hypothetical protein